MKWVMPLLAAALAGCSTTTVKYTAPDGATVSIIRRHILQTQQIADLAVKAGDRELRLKGYSLRNDREMAAAVTEAAVRGAVK